MLICTRKWCWVSPKNFNVLIRRQEFYNAAREADSVRRKPMTARNFCFSEKNLALSCFKM